MSFSRFAAALFLLASSTLAGCAADGIDDQVPAPTTSLSPSTVNLKGGAHAEPSFVDNGLTLSTSGALSGLGNEDLVVHMTAVGQPYATCTNPAGATQPAGQNPAVVTLSGSQSISASAIKNGNVAFALTTGAPAAVLEGAPGCPNPQWTERVVDVAFQSALITVEQGGSNVFTLTCTFSSPTKNGPVSAQSVTCS